LVGCVILLSVAASAWAATKTVKLKDGTKLVGEVTETEEGYIVRTRFGVKEVPRYLVEEILETPTPQEEYAERAAKLADDDYDGHRELGRWAMVNGLLDQAQKHVDHVLANTDDARATLIADQIEGLREKAAAAKEAEEAERRQREEAANQKPSTSGIDPKMLITMQEIYRIRLAEMQHFDPEDRDIRGMRINFKNNVLERLAERFEGNDDFDKTRFLRRWSDAEQLRYILDHTSARDHQRDRDDIEILTEVPFMEEYHRFVWPLLRQSMAAPTCHGSKEMHGGFRLLTAPSSVPSDEIALRVNYSNFILLDSFETDNGLMLIDRDRPEESLLLEFGLPKDVARFEHPDVAGMAVGQMYSGKDDPNYVRMLAWIRSLVGPVHPVYGISYQPLIGKPSDLEQRGPTTAPTTAPADDPPSDDADADVDVDAEPVDDGGDEPADDEPQP